MTARVRVASPVTTFSGPVGEYVFVNGQFEGEITDGARYYFEQQGYSIETIEEARADDAAAAQQQVVDDQAAAVAAQQAADDAAAAAAADEQTGATQ